MDIMRSRERDLTSSDHRYTDPGNTPAAANRHLSNFPVENTGKERRGSASEEKGGFWGMPAGIRKAFKYRGSVGHSEAEKSVEERGWGAPRRSVSTSLSHGAEI
jgi:hypothetical protein